MPINEFKDEFHFLSNFHPSEFCDGYNLWPTVEHAYQANKSRFQKDRDLICAAETPGQAKQLGNEIIIRDDWEFIKTSVMLKLVRFKFRQNDDLRKLLLDTGSVWLVEGNRRHDNFWGDCFCGRCDRIPSQNVLGKILMCVREELRP